MVTELTALIAEYGERFEPSKMYGATYDRSRVEMLDKFGRLAPKVLAALAVPDKGAQGDQGNARAVTIGPDAANSYNRRLFVDGSQWCKVYGWDSESAQGRAESIADVILASHAAQAERIVTLEAGIRLIRATAQGDGHAHLIVKECNALLSGKAS
jgi:hypothetical protein